MIYKQAEIYSILPHVEGFMFSWTANVKEKIQAPKNNRQAGKTEPIASNCNLVYRCRRIFMWIWKLTKVKVERWVHFRGSWHFCHPTIGCEWIQNHRVLPVTIVVLYFYITIVPEKVQQRNKTKLCVQFTLQHVSERAINQLWALQVQLSLWSQ